jgi:hypothetical protein
LANPTHFQSTNQKEAVRQIPSYLNQAPSSVTDWRLQVESNGFPDAVLCAA